MAYLMTAKDFVEKVSKIQKSYKTAYMLGTFGWSATPAMIERAITKADPTNAKRPTWQARAKAIQNEGFLFDCVGLIKGVLWGWYGNKSANYGGGKYASHGVPDTGADGMIAMCAGGGSKDFSTIVPGEVVWLKGHIGVYVGNGLVVEATPAWKGGVQLSLLGNINAASSTVSNKRTWTKHGKLPWINYEVAPAVTAPAANNTIKHIQNLANKGVISSPDYWTIHYKDVKYLSDLIIKCDNKMKAKGTPAKTITEALNNLIKSGVISSPDYWTANYNKIPYLEAFIKILGGCKY